MHVASVIRYKVFDCLLFPSVAEQLHDFRGHQFKIVTLTYFPLIDYEKVGEGTDVILSPRDSLDIRIANVIAWNLNFT